MTETMTYDIRCISDAKLWQFRASFQKISGGICARPIMPMRCSRSIIFPSAVALFAMIANEPIDR
jgi:hypothetical protein